MNSEQCPKEELYGLTSQLRRAVLSIPLNVIEGFARRGNRDRRQFLYIVYGSLKETKYLLYFAHRENFLSGKDCKKLLSLAEEVGKMIWASIRTIEDKISSN